MLRLILPLIALAFFTPKSEATYSDFSYSYKHQYGKDKYHYWDKKEHKGYSNGHHQGDHRNCNAPSAMDLGAADDFMIATGGYGSVTLGAGSTVDGNVGAGFVLNIGAGTTIDGKACAGYALVGSGVDITGSGSCPSRWSLYNSIQNASNVLASYSPYPFMDITSSKRLKEGVYSVNDFTLDSGDTLTLSGGKDDVLVVNVHGLAKLESGSKILLQGGLSADNVYFNFLGSYGYDTFQTTGAEIVGNFISNTRRFIIDAASNANSRFFTNSDILANFQSIQLPPDDSMIISVPLKGGFAVLLVMFLFNRKNKITK